LLILLLCCGCAFNGARFSEKLYDSNGMVTSKTNFITVVGSTFGSTLLEGAGSISYKTNDWQLDVGQNAQGMQSGGDINTLMNDVRAIVEQFSAPTVVKNLFAPNFSLSPFTR
jgi:hypothetical protein